MIVKILLALGVLIVVFLLVAALQRAAFRIERRISVSAPPAAAFAYLNDFHKWQEMSPYVNLDPVAKYTFSGPALGSGASLAWSGNGKVGEGRMTIVESRPAERVRMTLEFNRPFTCTNTVEFTFRPNGAQTEVTWSMFGQNGLMAKAMGLVINMDKMVGKDFERGLANLKTLAEAAAKKS